jgi:hypothetical protein
MQSIGFNLSSWFAPEGRRFVKRRVARQQRRRGRMVLFDLSEHLGPGNVYRHMQNSDEQFKTVRVDDEPPLDESGDEAILAQARAEHAAAQDEYHAKCEPFVDSLFKFADRRHKAREEAIKEGKLLDVLRSDAALERSVSDAETIVESWLQKGGVDEPTAQLTRTVVSSLGRMFLGLGPSHRDILETSRMILGDERTPEQKAADRERLMAAAERLKVKLGGV